MTARSTTRAASRGRTWTGRTRSIRRPTTAAARQHVPRRHQHAMSSRPQSPAADVCARYDPGMSATRYMRRCLELAANAARAGDTPVGALIVRGDDVIAEGIECVRATRDPTAHAEVDAIRKACQQLETLDLRGCSIYSTVEPCVLCGYAIRRTGIAHVIYGVAAGQAGAWTSSYAILTDRALDGWPDVPTVTAGVLADECLAALRNKNQG